MERNEQLKRGPGGRIIPVYVETIPMPACFENAKQWADYMAAYRISFTNGYLNRHEHCLDCTREYQTTMRQLGRCAHPDVTFRADRDGIIVGKRPFRKGIDDGAGQEEGGTDESRRDGAGTGVRKRIRSSKGLRREAQEQAAGDGAQARADRRRKRQASA